MNRVLKYIPDRMYGFVSTADGCVVFFHLGNFIPGNDIKDDPVQPLIGEEVLIETAIEPTKDTTIRAKKVIRINQPQKHYGIVKSFDANRGYGFITAGYDNNFFHRSDVIDKRILISGNRVEFYLGEKSGKVRCCYVRLLEI